MTNVQQPQPSPKPKPRPHRPESADCLTISVDRAAELLGISRNSAYEAVRSGTLPSIRFGKRIRVPTVALQKLLEQYERKVS